jgi:hypothetical protein
MKSLLSPAKVLLVLVSLFLFSSQSFASIVGGNITSGGSGIFINLSAPGNTLPTTIAPNIVDEINLYAFNEQQDVQLAAPLTVNVTGAGVGNADIATGTFISSHQVFFDPLYGLDQMATVTFSQAILGIITLTADLVASDFLGADLAGMGPGSGYTDFNLRGLESADSALFTLMDPNSITIDWKASSPGDFIRVITASAVPIPAAFWLFGSAILAIVGWSRKESATASA